MRPRKLLASCLICTLIFSYTIIWAGAVEVSSTFVVSPRVSISLNHEISANTIAPVEDWFYASSRDTITYNCTYTPKSASVDFGYIDTNSVFHYLNCTSGSINKSFEFSQRGQYRLAIRNNASYPVVVSGTVKY